MAHPLTPSRLFRGALAWGLAALSACVPEVALPDDAEVCSGLRCNVGQCVSNAGQPMCLCGAWEAAAHPPQVDCALGGALEPDDHGASPGDATELTLPMGSQLGFIGSAARGGATDRDLFAFTAVDRHLYAFSCKPGAVKGVTFCSVRLLDADGQVTPVTNGAFEDATTRFATLAAGRWYLEVSNERSSGYYEYQLRDLGQDDHGDVPTKATVLQGPGTGFPVMHSTAYDWDLFTFRPRVNHTYQFSCVAESPSAQGSRGWEVRATNGVGATLASAGGTSNEATVKFMPGSAESVLLHVLGRSVSYPALSSCELRDLSAPP